MITAVEESDGQDSSVVRRPIVIVSINDTIVITLSNSSHHLTHTAITLISLNNRSSKLIRAWKEGGCRRGVVAQWQSTGGSSQKPWVGFPAAPLFLSSPCRFKGLRTVAAPIVSLIDTITMGLRTTEESCPPDSFTAVITLSNSSHHYFDLSVFSLCCMP